MNYIIQQALTVAGGEVNENANKDSRVLNVQRDLIAGVVSKEWVKASYPAELTETNRVHIHDQDYLFQSYTNCCLFDLGECLDNGTVINGVKIGTPNSLRVAATITTQLVATVAAQQYGGVSVHGVDTTLAKYAAKSYNKHLSFAETRLGLEPVNCHHYADKMTLLEIKDSIQSLTYQINTLALANGQSAFVTIGFGADSSKWAKAITEAILRDRIAGIGIDGVTPTFPKLIYHVKAGINLHQDDPDYHLTLLAAECSSKRMYPDIISDDKAIEQYGYTYTPMGCRSVPLQYEHSNGKLTINGSLNLGVVSINLPLIAQTVTHCMHPQEAFISELHKSIDLVEKAHLTRLERLQTVRAGVAPLLWQHGGLGLRLGAEDLIYPHLSGRATVSVGYIGFSNVCEMMFGDDHYQHSDFVKCVLGIINERAEAFTTKHNIKMSVYGTPAESLCGKWSDDYYVNSFHTKPNKKVNPFDRLSFESQFVPLSGGGHIVYVELGDVRHNLPALITLWQHGAACTPYFAVNTNADTCLSCGYDGALVLTETEARCPACGETHPEKLNVLRRVSGYLTVVKNTGGKHSVNSSKLKEMLDRVKND